MAFEILGVKLSSGEEIIGKVKPVSTNLGALSAQEVFDGKTNQAQDQLGGKLPENVILYDVRQIHIQQVGPNQMGLGLSPWVLGNQEAELQVNLKQHALTVYRPSPEIEEAYMQQTSSIQLAKAGSVPGVR